MEKAEEEHVADVADVTEGTEQVPVPGAAAGSKIFRRLASCSPLSLSLIFLEFTPELFGFLQVLFPGASAGTKNFRRLATLLLLSPLLEANFTLTLEELAQCRYIQTALCPVYDIHCIFYRLHSEFQNVIFFTQSISFESNFTPRKALKLQNTYIQ